MFDGSRFIIHEGGKSNRSAAKRRRDSSAAQSSSQITEVEPRHPSEGQMRQPLPQSGRLQESWDATFYGRHMAYSAPARSGPTAHQQVGSDAQCRLFASTGPKQTRRCRGRRQSSRQALEPGMLGQHMRHGAATTDSRSGPCCYSEQSKSCWPTPRAMLKSTSFPNPPSLQASRYPDCQHL